MKFFYRRLLSLLALATFTTAVYAQLPNEKFGKPSSMEWEFMGWGDAMGADAIILSKTMKVTYKISDQVSNNMEGSDFGFDNLSDFGKNNVDESNILVNYEMRLRTKILKPEGAKYANIDITTFDASDDVIINTDELQDLKVTVFSKNEKGKVVKRFVKPKSFVKERVDANYVVTHVVVPDVQAGSIVEYQYNITSTRAVFLYDWLFQECIPTVHSKCDIEIPAFLQFQMNAPINKLIQSNVEAGRLAYDVNRADLKRAKSCPTNHYTIVGDYILPVGQAPEVIAPLTSKINMPHVTLPAYMPEGRTHLKIVK